MEIKSIDKLLTYAETIQQTLDHPALTTSFQVHRHGRTAPAHPTCGLRCCLY